MPVKINATAKDMTNRISKSVKNPVKYIQDTRDKNTQKGTFIMDVRVKHISGLGFTPSSYVTIKKAGEQLAFLGVEGKEAVAGFKGVNEPKQEKVEVQKKIHLADIVSVKLNPNVESSSDYGTVVKTFIVLTIRNSAGFTYEAHLAGDEFKRVTPAYNDLIKILTEG